MSIVIVTFFSERTLEGCLRSVFDSTAEGDEVCVVDNASGDETLSVVERFANGRIRLEVIRNPENRGYSAAANQGIRSTSHPYVVLLNPDTFVWPGWIEGLLARCTTRGVGAAGPLSDRVAGRQFIGFHLPPHERRMGHEEIAKTVRWMHAGASEETKLLIGFCLMVSRQVFESVGLLDEDLFLGSDDLELSWRLQLNGFRLLIAKDVYVQHLENRSLTSMAKNDAAQLLSESTACLRRKVADHYGSDPPSSTELWGIPILPDNDCGLPQDT